jgi:hypothetical protein
MSEIKTVWEQGSMSTTLETLPPRELIDHIGTTYLGTPGGLQYHHTTGIEKLKNMKTCYFVFLRRSGKMLGSIGYALREAHAGEATYKCWLVRYFAIKAPLRSNEVTRKQRSRRPVKDRSASLIKMAANYFHDNPERLIDPDTTEMPKAILYSLVEKKNERSRNFAEIGGYEKTGDVVSFMFSRLKQRDRVGVEQFKRDDIPEMRSLLKDFYSDHAFYLDDNLFLNGDYYVLRENGEIVAGLQANEEMWAIKTIGNARLDRIIKSLTRIPFIGKRFKYEQMRFLGVEGIFFREGRGDAVYTLLEGVLARKDQYLALMIMDTRSSVYLNFKQRKRLGPVNTFLGSFEADFYTRFYSFPEEEKKKVSAMPAYISIFDNT